MSNCQIKYLTQFILGQYRACYWHSHFLSLKLIITGKEFCLTKIFLSFKFQITNNRGKCRLVARFNWGFFDHNAFFYRFWENRALNVVAFGEENKSRNFHWLTWIYSRLTAIWSGWLNVRVVLSNRLLSEQLPHYHPATSHYHTPSTQHCTLFKGEIWPLGKLLDSGWGMKMLVWAVWLGTKQDLVVRHTLLTYQHCY